MSYRIEYSLSGLVLRDESGARIVTMTILRDGDGARVVTLGSWPPEVEIPREAVDHIAKLWSRLSRSLRFPPELVKTGLPATTSPWS